MDSAVPPALARLQHMNQDIIGGRNALTPVLNRDDAMREWERRQAGKATAAQPYPQLEFLQQQAEMVGSSGMNSWSGTAQSARYPPPPSKLSHTYQPTIMIDDDNVGRREPVMSNVRTAARSEGAVYSGSAVISSPPQAYTSNATTAGNRYPANFNQNQGVSSFEQDTRRGTDIGNIYVPMQPEQYQSYSGGPPPPTSARHAVPPPTSFYGSAVMPSGQMNPNQTRNPFQVDGQQQQPMAGGKGRGNGGIDAWQR